MERYKGDGLIGCELWGETLLFSEEVLKLENLRNDFDDYSLSLIKLVGEFYNNNKEIITNMYAHNYNDYLYQQLWYIVENIKQYLNQYISTFIEYGINDKSVDDYLESNKNLSLLIEMTDLNYKIKQSLWQQMNNQAIDQMNNAHSVAYSQVTGNKFGIITNSITASILYGIENDYRIRKQTAAANKQYWSDIEKIGAAADQWFQDQWINHFLKYMDNLLAILRDIVQSLFAQIAYDYVQCGLIDESIFQYIEDAEKSNKILNNIDLAADKRKIIIDTLKANPFNSEAYEKICELGFLDEDVVRMSSIFGMKQTILQYTEEVIKELCDSRKYQDNKLKEYIRYLSMMNDQSEQDNFQQILQENNDKIVKLFRNMKYGIYQKKVVEQVYSYIYIQNNCSSIEDLFDKIYAYYALDELNTIINKDNLQNIIKKGLSVSLNDFLDVKQYFIKTYTKVISAKKGEVEKRKRDICLKEQMLKDIEKEISENNDIILLNKNKLWGEGAKNKKSAKENNEKLKEKYNDLLNEIKQLKDVKIEQSDRMPFID